MASSANDGCPLNKATLLGNTGAQVLFSFLLQCRMALAAAALARIHQGSLQAGGALVAEILVFRIAASVDDNLLLKELLGSWIAHELLLEFI